MTGYEPRIEPPSLPTWRTPWAVIPVAAWLLVEVPFIAFWVVRAKYRSVRAPRPDVAFALAISMQQVLSIAEYDQAPKNKRETALVAARNLRTVAEDLGLQGTGMVARNLDRLEDLEERGLAMPDGGTVAAEADSDAFDLHAFCHDCDWYATPDDHEYATVWAAADVHMTFEGHKVRVGLGEETKEEAQTRARAGDEATPGGAA